METITLDHNIVVDILLAVVSLVLTRLGHAAVGWLNAHKRAYVRAEWYYWVETGVKAMDQALRGDGRGPERKARLMADLKRILPQLTTEQLDLLIESVVGELHLVGQSLPAPESESMYV